MLTISARQMQALAHAQMIERVRTFLHERSRHPKMAPMLAQPERWKPLWQHLLNDCRFYSEYDYALALAFALACLCEGLDPCASIDEAIATADPKYAMKSFLAAHAYLRFSELDLDTPARAEA